MSNSATFFESCNQPISVKDSTVNVVGEQAQSSPTNSEGSLVFDDIFVDDRKPWKGSRVCKGHQEHANGRRIPIAIKMIAPFQKKNLTEVDHLVTLTPHPNVVSIIRSEKCEGRVCPELYIVMELCKSETFKDYCEKLPFNFGEIMSFCEQLLKGIKHIHDKKIIHGDVNPENILFSLDGKSIKVANFGVSKQLRGGMSKTKCTGQGTESFRAPETYNSNVISRKADIYSLGVTLFFAFTKGCHPFGDDPHLQIYNMKNDKGLDFSALPDEMPEPKKSQFCDLLHKMLSFKPCNRPTINEVLHDAFFTSGPKDEEQMVPNERKIWPRILRALSVILLLGLAIGLAPIPPLDDTSTGLENVKKTFWLNPDMLDYSNPKVRERRQKWKAYLFNGLDAMLMKNCVAGNIFLRIVPVGGEPRGKRLFNLDQGHHIFFGYRIQTPYLKSRQFRINGNIKSVSELQPTTFPGLLGDVQTATSSPGLVIWYDTERDHYVFANLGDEKMTFYPRSVVPSLLKRIPKRVSCRSLVKESIRSCRNPDEYMTALKFFEITIESDTRCLTLEMYLL